MDAIALRHLELVHFKNHTQSKLDFDAKMICITGNNGMGKTNILDAIYTLCMCKSYNSFRQSDIIQYDQSFVRLVGEFKKGNQVTQVVVKYPRRGSKTFIMDDKPYRRLKDHIGKLPIVIITPDDVQLLLGGSIERRTFIDNTICQMDRNYLDALSEYKHLHKQKSTLLKSDKVDISVLEIYNEKMAKAGSIIHQNRQVFFQSFEALVQEAYHQISGAKERIGLSYQSQLNEAQLTNLLNQNFHKEIIAQRCLYGTHKDDMVILMNEQPIKSVASQGQRKSTLLALKIAQFELLKTALNYAPIILLDDLFDKLDDHRVRHLIELITKGEFGQIFITDTNTLRLKNALKDIAVDSQWVTVEDGKILDIS